MAEHVSRRRVLALSGAAFGLSPTDSQTTTSTDEPVVDGWVTKGRKSRIAAHKAVVEDIEDPGSTLCNGGELYRCRTCSGDAFYLLVGFGTPQPSVGDVYRFDPTGNDNWCGNFEVRLSETGPCESAVGATAEGTAGSKSAGAETETTTTETTETTTTETTTTETDGEASAATTDTEQ